MARGIERRKIFHDDTDSNLQILFKRESAHYHSILATHRSKLKAQRSIVINPFQLSALMVDALLTGLLWEEEAFQ
jgi:hypothetical protein